MGYMGICRVVGLGVIMKNQMEKNMENKMQAGIISVRLEVPWKGVT